MNDCPHIVRFSGTGSANSAHTKSSTVGQRYRLLYVTVAYSGAPTQTGVIVVLNSGLGAAFDTQLSVGSANQRYHFYAPDGDVVLENTDTIDVLAPAGGGSLTASTVIVLERLT